MTDRARRPFPSIAQSFAVFPICLIAMLLWWPATFLDSWIDDEWTMLLIFGGGMGTTWLVLDRWRRWQAGASSYNFAPGSPKCVIASGAGGIALMVGVVGPLMEHIPGPDWMLESLEEIVIELGPAMFLTGVVVAPLFEELIFRGVILDGLLQRHGALGSVLISSTLFGLMHLNPWQFVTGLVIGSYAGWVYVRTRSVGACIALHATVNFAAFLAGAVPGEDPVGDYPLLFSTEASFLVARIAISAAVFAASFLVLRAEFRGRE